MQRFCGLVVSCLLLSACGSNGNAVVIVPPSPNLTPATSTPSGNGGGGTPTPTPTRGSGATPTHGGPATSTPGHTSGTPTPTRISGAGKTLYVRASGNDSNPGTSPGAALQTVAQAVKLMGAGTKVFVGPGRYTEPAPGRLSVTSVAGTTSAPAELIADPTGAQTGDAAGEVILDASGDTVAVEIQKSPFLIIDGFTITGAVPGMSVPTPGATPVKVSATEVNVLKSSDNATVRNCIIGQSSSADAIRIDASANVLVFDNLLFEIDRGVVVTGGATGARVINNTIVMSQRSAVNFAEKSMVAPTGGTVLNNIIEAQSNKTAINIGQGPPSAQDGYMGDFNLVFEAAATDQSNDYIPPGVKGSSDINTDGLLISLASGDVHLSHDSPAIDAGTEDIDPSLIGILTARSTRDDGSLDQRPVDMGYHYPQ